MQLSRVACHALWGVVFDMGDVLHDATAWRRWLVQVLSRMGRHVEYRACFEIWDRQYLDDVHRGRREYGEAFWAFLISLGLSRAEADEVEAASQSRRRELETGARPFPGVRATLQRLRECDYRLGVLSDSESSAGELRTRLARLGLEGMFDGVISSLDLGTTKPDPRCYQAALEALGLTASQAAFVGHDAEELAGAARAGLRTIGFNCEAGVQAEVLLNRFDDLLATLEHWSTCAAAI